MNDYAIIATGGKQRKVKTGDTIAVEKLEGGSGDIVVFDKVLLVSNGDGVNIGRPYVLGASVTGELTAQVKDKKKIHFRYKNKTRGGRKQGHRQKLTEVSIKTIEISSDEQPVQASSEDS